MVGNVFGFLFVWLKRGEGCTLQCVSMNVQCVSMNVLLLQQCGSLSGLWPEFQRKTCAETFWGSSLGHPLRCCQSHHLVGMVRYRVVSEHTLACTALLSPLGWHSKKLCCLGTYTGMLCVVAHLVGMVRNSVVSEHTLACTALLSISPLGRHGEILCCLWTHAGMDCVVVNHTTRSENWHVLCYCLSPLCQNTGMHCIIVSQLGQNTGMHCVLVYLTTWSEYWHALYYCLSHNLVRILACTVLLSISPLGQNTGMHCAVVCLTTWSEYWHALCCCLSHHLVSIVRYSVVSLRTHTPA